MRDSFRGLCMLAGLCGLLACSTAWASQTLDVLLDTETRALVSLHQSELTKTWQVCASAVGVATPGSVAPMGAQMPDSSGLACEALCKVKNRVLLPAADALSGLPVTDLALYVTVQGFGLRAAYPFDGGQERFELEFAWTAGPDGWAPALVSYQKQRLSTGGEVVSGLIADYRLGMARWLGPGNPPGQGARQDLAPVQLQLLGPVWLADLPSVFDFSPALDVPVRH